MNNVFSLDLLRAFVAVVDSRSFTIAAQQLHSTQSTVSQKILRLEEAAGQSLLERARHDIRPTDAGEKLLGYARRMLHLHDEAAAAMTGDALAAVFRLGLAEDFAARLVTPALAVFLRAHPNMKLEVTSGLSRELQKGFETGEFDLVMIKQRRGELWEPCIGPNHCHGWRARIIRFRMLIHCRWSFSHQMDFTATT